MRLVEPARETRPVRIASDPTDAMAADAERLPRTAMAARARHGVEPRGTTVLSSSRAHPTGRMRAPRARSCADVLVGMAIGAEGRLLVAGGAEPWVRASLVGMTHAKAGAMQSGERGPLGLELPRKRRHGDAMTREAEALGVTGRAQVARARGTHAVLANEVTVVNDVAARCHELAGQVDVTAIAISGGPLVAMLVASEALRHGRPESRRVVLTDGGMARHALSVEPRSVLGVREAKVLPGERRLLAKAAFPMAAAARARVVGLRMARRTLLARREVQWSRIAGRSNRFMALDAGNAMKHVRAVLERVLEVLRLDSEDAGARGEHGRQDENERQGQTPARHRATVWKA